MKIGIDVSQLAFENTGVANYLQNLIQSLTKVDNKNEYILFFSSLRRKFKKENLNLDSSAKVSIMQFKIPPVILDILWNKLHILPIEKLIGPVDVFITSDWTEPPVKSAKKATILYDLIVYKFPEETDKKIVETQKRKLAWVKKETSRIFCISKSTAEDAEKILGIEKSRLSVMYPGI